MLGQHRAVLIEQLDDLEVDRLVAAAAADRGCEVDGHWGVADVLKSRSCFLYRSTSTCSAHATSVRAA